MPSTVVDLANEVHDDLLKLVAPASPASIRASSFGPRRNLPLFAITVLAFVFLAIFAIPTFRAAPVAGTADDFNDFFRILGGAGLGSAFYALNTANTYVKTSTFDPKYSQTYLVRFGIGVLSGIILAYFLKDLPIAKGGGIEGLQGVKVGALALIGGYAAEAVTRVLDRVSETLVALISGSDRDKIDAARTKAEAEAEKKTKLATGEAVRKLQTALDAADTKAAVQKVIGEMLK